MCHSARAQCPIGIMKSSPDGENARRAALRAVFEEFDTGC
jgi:hypothetical protein